MRKAKNSPPLPASASEQTNDRRQGSGSGGPEPRGVLADAWFCFVGNRWPIVLIELNKGLMITYFENKKTALFLGF